MPIVGPPLKQSLDLRRLLARGLDAYPDSPALVSAEERWTWRELERASDQLALRLLELGLSAGDRVASLMPNRAVLMVHYIACIKAGLVATPLNYRYMAPEIDHALEVSEASILLAHAERAADLAASRRAGSLPLGFISYAGELERSPRLEDLIQPRDATVELPPTSPSAPAFVLFTSGSTGRPKGVTHTVETLGWMAASTSAGLELTTSDILLPGSSISHIGALQRSLAALGSGVRIDVARTFDGDELLPLLRQTRPTVLNMLPAALIALIRDHDARPEDFASLRLCMSGGDKVSSELEREFTELAGIPILEVYGMTETGLCTITPPSGTHKIGSVGRPAPGFRLAIRDDEGRELPTGSEGRLWVQSPSDTVGYWKRPDATAETIQDGWLDTGDVMRADADSYLWFCGRKKQIIVHDGSNICPQEVEEALLAHQAVAAVGVVGIHDALHGENVRAYVSLAPGASPPARQELIRFARARIGYKAPEQVVVLSEMPLNATGKIDRVALKKLAEAHLDQGTPH